MKDTLIRKAVMSDLPVLKEFLQMLVNAERPFDETLDDGNLIYYDIEELIENNNSEVLVLENNNVPVGCGYAQIREAKPFLKHDKYAHFGFMFVLAEYRGRGLNNQLITALKSWVSSKGVKEVRLEVYVENEAAIRAYEKTGFEKILMTMRCEID